MVLMVQLNQEFGKYHLVLRRVDEYVLLFMGYHLYMLIAYMLEMNFRTCLIIIYMIKLENNMEQIKHFLRYMIKLGSTRNRTKHRYRDG